MKSFSNLRQDLMEVTTETWRGLDVYVDLTARQLYDISEKMTGDFEGSLRGIAVGGEKIMFWWDASEATHDEAAYKLGLTKGAIAGDIGDQNYRLWVTNFNVNDEMRALEPDADGVIFEYDDNDFIREFTEFFKDVKKQFDGVNKI